jgi:3-dehydrosphinganine reductase
MRLEAMRYSGPVSKYIVQCIFAHNYITETFLVEQKTKPELCKRIEGTSSTELSELEKHFPYASKIAPEIVANVLSNDFAVMDKRMDPQALWANMIGTSPKRGWGIVDSLLALLTGFLLIPRIRRDMERKCLGDALRDDDKTK